MLKEELLTVSFTTFPTSCGIYRKWALAGVENKVEVCNGGGYPTESWN